MLQEKLLADENSDEDVDFTDSDDDATWTPFKDKDKGENAAENAVKRPFKEAENEALSSPKKQKKAAAGSSSSSSSAMISGQVTSLVPDGEDLRTGDFVVLVSDLDRENAPIWRLDSKTLLQRYNATAEPGGNGFIHKSANLFAGFTAGNREKYSSVAVRFVSVESSTTSVRVIQRARKNAGGNAGGSANYGELRARSRAETGQFQENFEVYIQALISQCLDSNFLDEVFNDQGETVGPREPRFPPRGSLTLKMSFSDDYFVSNIEKVDSVTLLRKDKVMSGVVWSTRFHQAVSTWPCFNDLGSAAAQVPLSFYETILPK